MAITQKISDWFTGKGKLRSEIERDTKAWRNTALAALVTLGVMIGGKSCMDAQAGRRAYLESCGLRPSESAEVYQSSEQAGALTNVFYPTSMQNPLERVALENSATNPNMPFADNFDYIPGMDDNFPEKSQKNNVPKRLNAPRTDTNGINIPAMRCAFGGQESSNKVNSTNRDSGAAGTYQFLPSTALEEIKKARVEGYDIPYSGPLTESAVAKALKTDCTLNDSLMDYVLIRKSRVFDGNPELIAASHYASEQDVLGALKKAYPSRSDFSDVKIDELAKKRPWIAKPQWNNGRKYPSVKSYAQQVSNRYLRIASRN